MMEYNLLSHLKKKKEEWLDHKILMAFYHFIMITSFEKLIIIIISWLFIQILFSF